MALFNRGQRRFHQDLFGQLQELPAEVTVNAAGAIAKAGFATATAGLTSMFSTPESGTTRSGANFKGTGKKRNINQTTNSDTSRSVRRRISTGPDMPRFNGPPTSKGQIQSTQEGGGNEIPVINPPRNVAKITPDYFTVMLPYYSIHSLTAGEVNGTNSVQIRLNSIYDPVEGTFGNRQPQGRDIWSATWQFYRVLETRVKLTWLNGQFPTTVARPSGTIWAVGYEFLEDGATPANGIDAFMITKHAKRDMLGPATHLLGDGATVHTNIPSQQTLTHHYAPHEWDYHVQESSSEARWTPISQNPSDTHHLAVRTMGLDGQAVQANQMELIIQIEYVVQFREVFQSLIKQLDTGDATT